MTKAETIAMKAMKDERKCSSQPLYTLTLWKRRVLQFYYFSAKLVVGRAINISIPSFFTRIGLKQFYYEIIRD
ncbi:hypothetical protein TSUD_155680 [Trifolium subterraneum]|uniref:Uncharacterized protein n=1 Tax=Trifolium subterraneum TaxID=3900 RepID=A0A2Z6N157_TRISU|nr:hypothetical protein TSUD_155680 [Trifolium subterraneum]